MHASKNFTTDSLTSNEFLKYSHDSPRLINDTPAQSSSYISDLSSLDDVFELSYIPQITYIVLHFGTVGNRDKSKIFGNVCDGILLKVQ